jgi:hypothetical protein
MVSGVFEWRGALAVLLDPEALERPDLPLAA